jgi:hypothetical protein
MSGRQKKYQHLLDRTFNRPRDIIKFCNEIMTSYKARLASGTQPADMPSNRLINEDIISARRAYSEYFYKELEDEIHKHLPNYTDMLDIIRSIGIAGFRKEQLEAACARRPNLIAMNQKPLDIARQLFAFSVVAYQKTGGSGGGSEYVWRYLDTGARFDETASVFRVHPGLIEVLGLKRW